MDRARFVQLVLVAFGLVFVSFLIRGTIRLFAPYDLAIAASAPFLFVAGVLVVGLLALAVLDVTGIRPME